MALFTGLESNKDREQGSGSKKQWLAKESGEPLLFVGGVVGGAHHVDGDVGFVADDPAVVAGLDVEDVAGIHLDDAAIIHCRSGSTGDNHTDVGDIAALLAQGFADVLGPAPTGLIRGAADGHAAEMDEFELAFFEGADFVGVLELLEDNLVHGS
jgi:hypothetical protein